ncbi:MAG: hypothetical protein Q6373_012460 [Candidatus Sigynarchaeota archaeon]
MLFIIVLSSKGGIRNLITWSTVVAARSPIADIKRFYSAAATLASDIIVLPARVSTRSSRNTSHHVLITPSMQNFGLSSR